MQWRMKIRRGTTKSWGLAHDPQDTHTQLNFQGIGLVGGLLNMPPQDDDYAGEREALLNALYKLSKESGTKSHTVLHFQH